METQNFDSVIGLIGLKASGKDEFGIHTATHYGFTQTRVSDAIRAEAARLGITDPTTVQLQDLGNRGRALSNDGGFWPKELLKLMSASGKRLVVINGIRHPDEISALKEILGNKFVAVGIIAPVLLRAARFLKRRQAGDPITLEDFLAIDDRDRGIGEPPHGQQVDRAMALVPWENLYNNIGTLEEYHLWIDSLIKGYRPQLFCDK